MPATGYEIPVQIGRHKRLYPDNVRFRQYFFSVTEKPLQTGTQYADISLSELRQIGDTLPDRSYPFRSEFGFRWCDGFLHDIQIFIAQKSRMDYVPVTHTVECTAGNFPSSDQNIVSA